MELLKSTVNIIDYMRKAESVHETQRDLGNKPKGKGHSDGRYYRKSIEIIDTYKSIDTFDTRKKYR